jgi:3-oxoacyl-[acyl-carrier-protein] synthase II
VTVAITGVGAVSAFGLGIEALFDGLAAGRSAISRIRSFDASTFPTHVAGEVPVVDAGALLGDVAIEPAARRDRKLAWGLLAADEAWRMAGCGDAERAASLVIALGLEQAFLEDLVPIYDRGTLAWDRATPDLMFRTPVDLCARAIHARLGLRGPTVVNASACAAGTLAIAHAASLIERGAAEIVVCGGADAMVNPLGLGGMCRLGAPSPRDELDACRPFDRRRDGLVIGEGAAMFVVEDLARARARGARPLALILGWGSSADGYRATAPLPDGRAAQAAMARAIARSGGADIGYINAHGTGTQQGDIAESQATFAVFGGATPVSSLKSYMGHTLGACGALEAWISIEMMRTNWFAPTINLDQVDAACAPLDYIAGEGRALECEYVMSNNFAFGGINTSLIFKRYFN